MNDPVSQLSRQSNNDHENDDDSNSDSERRKQCQFRDNLKRVLLAINFNFNFYYQIPGLKKFYEPHFGKVVFCGYEKSSSYEILKLNVSRGRHAYQCLALAIERYANYDGYFYSNDDVILNFWNLNFNLDKVWLGQKPDLKYAAHVRGKRPFPKGIWWPKSGPRCEQVFKKLNLIAGKTKSKISVEFTTPPIRANELRRLLQIYLRNSGMKELCMKAWSDAFYVPKKHAAVYVQLSHMFAEEKVFLEIAVTTILHMLDDVKDMVQMNGMYHVDAKNGFRGSYSFYRSYSFNLTFSHPFKMSTYHAKKFFELAIIPHAEKMVVQCNDSV